MTQCRSRSLYNNIVFSCRLQAGHENPNGEHEGQWHTGQKLDLSRGRIVTLSWRPGNHRRERK